MRRMVTKKQFDGKQNKLIAGENIIITDDNVISAIGGGGGGGSISVYDLFALTEGSDTISVDLNENDTKVGFKLDEQYKNTLATKAEIAIKQDKLSDKQLANITAVDSKADATATTQAISLKADTTYVDKALAKKADTTYVDQQLGLKVNTSYVVKELGKKQNKLVAGKNITIVGDTISAADRDSSILSLNMSVEQYAPWMQGEQQTVYCEISGRDWDSCYKIKPFFYDEDITDSMVTPELFKNPSGDNYILTVFDGMDIYSLIITIKTMEAGTITAVTLDKRVYR